ncbi:MAG: TIGR00266 family protein [Planctomycetota bacterium]|nr:MAG: TIGR00266 family protein [Planctomycetota bacterium]
MTPTPPPLPSGARVYPRRSHEIDFRIHGDDMQFIEVDLDPGETVIAEAGSMMFMSDGIRMETVFGDPSQPQQDFFGKLLSAGKRVLTGESLFMTTFTAGGPRRETIAFAAPYPGKIVEFDLRELGGELLCQKDSFLCAAKGVTIGIAFTKRFGAGLFGGEGFILQRLAGDGLAFMNAGGMVLRRTLAPGERLRVDTGCIVGFQPSVDYDIQFVGGFKNTLFGGEGLFFATLRGPGDIWLQSLPFSRLAGRIARAVLFRKEEGSVLGGLGNLFDGRE